MRKADNGRKFKKGAASFYIVAISTLILVIVAASFAAVIVSEVTRTSNDDLAQSAYDAALAGVEDAKLAYANYQTCKNGGVAEPGSMTCGDLIRAIDYSESDCDLVADALGRKVEVNDKGEKLGVLVQEKSTAGDENNMQQYYTCTKVSAVTADYLGELDSGDPEHSVRLRFRTELGRDEVDTVNRVKYVRLSWHSLDQNADSGALWNRFDWMKLNGDNGVFGPNKVTPAVVSLTLIQTGMSFSLSDFEMTNGGGSQTDRGTLYFVPHKGTLGGDTDMYRYAGTPYSLENAITAQDGFAKSNDKDVKNLPYMVPCSEGLASNSGYACSVVVELPAPIGGTRNPNTFMMSVALPYGEPKTDYQLEFLDASGTIMQLNGVQVSVDSTGRANDLFRRVDVRLEPADASFPYPIYGIEAFYDDDDKPAIEKFFDTTCEYTFEATCEGSVWGGVSYKIFYDLNGGNWDGSSPQTGTVMTTEVLLDAHGPRKEGFDFVGWCTVDGTSCNSGRLYQPGNPINIASGEVHLYAIWKDDKEPETMQEFGDYCNKMTEHQTLTLRDTRDNKTYTVAKLKDGKCWMTQNLRLGGDFPINLTSSESDVSENFTLPESSSNGFAEYDVANVYVDPTYGGYYTWYAATAGTGREYMSSGSATNSICPKGWRLPTGGDGGEFRAMASNYGSSSDAASWLSALQAKPVPGFALAGYYDHNFVSDQGGGGRYWSSTASGSGYAYRLYFGSPGVNPTGGVNREYYGYSVRCVSRE